MGEGIVPRWRVAEEETVDADARLTDGLSDRLRRASRRASRSESAADRLDSEGVRVAGPGREDGFGVDADRSSWIRHPLPRIGIAAYPSTLASDSGRPGGGEASNWNSSSSSGATGASVPSMPFSKSTSSNPPPRIELIPWRDDAPPENLPDVAELFLA